MVSFVFKFVILLMVEDAIFDRDFVVRVEIIIIVEKGGRQKLCTTFTSLLPWEYGFPGQNYLLISYQIPLEYWITIPILYTKLWHGCLYNLLLFL